MSAIDHIRTIHAKENRLESSYTNIQTTINLPVIWAIEPNKDPFDFPIIISKISKSWNVWMKVKMAT